MVNLETEQRISRWPSRPLPELPEPIYEEVKEIPETVPSSKQGRFSFFSKFFSSSYQGIKKLFRCKKVVEDGGFCRSKAYSEPAQYAFSPIEKTASAVEGPSDPKPRFSFLKKLFGRKRGVGGFSTNGMSSDKSPLSFFNNKNGLVDGGLFEKNHKETDDESECSESSECSNVSNRTWVSDSTWDACFDREDENEGEYTSGRRWSGWDSIRSQSSVATSFDAVLPTPRPFWKRLKALFCCCCNGNEVDPPHIPSSRRHSLLSNVEKTVGVDNTAPSSPVLWGTPHSINGEEAAYEVGNLTEEEALQEGIQKVLNHKAANVAWSVAQALKSISTNAGDVAERDDFEASNISSLLLRYVEPGRHRVWHAEVERRSPCRVVDPLGSIYLQKWPSVSVDREIDREKIIQFEAFLLANGLDEEYIGLEGLPYGTLLSKMISRCAIEEKDPFRFGVIFFMKREFKTLSKFLSEWLNIENRPGRELTLDECLGYLENGLSQPGEGSSETLKRFREKCTQKVLGHPAMDAVNMFGENIEFSSLEMKDHLFWWILQAEDNFYHRCNLVNAMILCMGCPYWLPVADGSLDEGSNEDTEGMKSLEFESNAYSEVSTGLTENTGVEERASSKERDAFSPHFNAFFEANLVPLYQKVANFVMEPICEAYSQGVKRSKVSVSCLSALLQEGVPEWIKSAADLSLEAGASSRFVPLLELSHGETFPSGDILWDLFQQKCLNWFSELQAECRRSTTKDPKELYRALLSAVKVEFLLCSFFFQFDLLDCFFARAKMLGSVEDVGKKELLLRNGENGQPLFFSASIGGFRVFFLSDEKCKEKQDVPCQNKACNVGYMVKLFPVSSFQKDMIAEVRQLVRDIKSQDVSIAVNVDKDYYNICKAIGFEPSLLK